MTTVYYQPIITAWLTKKHEDDIDNYNYNKGDYYAMRDDLLNIDWEAELRDKYTQQIWDTLKTRSMDS